MLSMSQLRFRWECAPQVLYKCMQEGMPYRKVGNEYEFDLEACEEWHRKGYFESLDKKHQDSIIREARKGVLNHDINRKKEDCKKP